MVVEEVNEVKEVKEVRKQKDYPVENFKNNINISLCKEDLGSYEAKIMFHSCSTKNDRT